LMALAARIATEAPRSPRALQAGLPRGLAAIVVRCLAKDRAARPPTYSALDEMLRPFGSAAATPELGPDTQKAPAGATRRVHQLPNPSR